MARTTIEDCLSGDDSHFDLAYSIPQRAHEIMRSGEAAVDAKTDKPIVIALRERAEVKAVEAALTAKKRTP